jgi:uncharacterized oxidoreductase
LDTTIETTSGSGVIICGRREDKLREAQATHPGFKTHVVDVGTAPDREAQSPT